MKTATVILASVALTAAIATPSVQAQDVTERPMVGQIGALAMAPDSRMSAELHHQGWIEARGQLLNVASYRELFNMIGRTWTSKRAPEGRFALPDIQDRSEHSISSDNPFGVLGPSDLVTSGSVPKDSARRNFISYWIYVGQDVQSVAASTARD